MFPNHIVGRSLALLLLYCFLYSEGETTGTSEVVEDETVCFETVTHYYSNPKITGKSVLQYTYKNDQYKSEELTLSCEEESQEEGGKDLYIEVMSVTLSLPSRGEDAQYCAESQETSYDNCKAAEQCDCCQKPDETCTVTLDTGQYNSCNRQKSCNITVKSKFLNDCPGRQYACDGKKCHSRWADVTYKCRPIDVIPTTSPHEETASGGLAWWIIFLIVAAIIIIIVVVFILYRRYCGDHTEMEEDKIEATKLNLGTEYEDETGPAEYAQVDKNKKTKKPGSCDAADVPAENQQRQSEIQFIDNEHYVGLDRNSGIETAYNLQNTEATDGPTKKVKTTKPAPPPPSNKPALSSLQQPPQVDGKKQESTATNKPNQQSYKSRPAPTKPSMTVAPPKPPGSGGSDSGTQPPKQTAPSKPRQPVTGRGSADAAPPKPPRLSDTDTGKSPTADNTYASTYGHFPSEGRERQPRV